MYSFLCSYAGDTVYFIMPLDEHTGFFVPEALSTSQGTHPPTKQLPSTSRAAIEKKLEEERNALLQSAASTPLDSPSDLNQNVPTHARGPDEPRRPLGTSTRVADPLFLPISPDADVSLSDLECTPTRVQTESDEDTDTSDSRPEDEERETPPRTPSDTATQNSHDVVLTQSAGSCVTQTSGGTQSLRSHRPGTSSRTHSRFESEMQAFGHDTAQMGFSSGVERESDAESTSASTASSFEQMGQDNTDVDT